MVATYTAMPFPRLETNGFRRINSNSDDFLNLQDSFPDLSEGRSL